MLSKDRSRGILLHISSLPSDDGIGTIGSGYDFVDFLKSAGQNIWQILPLTPVGRGFSPYSSPSAFAGNILFIDLSDLEKYGVRAGKLNFDNTGFVNYSAVIQKKGRLLFEAAENFVKNNTEYLSFCRENDFWLEDFAIFDTVRRVFQTNDIRQISKIIKTRDIKRENSELFENIKVLQYFFFSQWLNLKNYANKNGIKIVGDMPFYVDLSSSDVLANPELFSLNDDFSPRLVAGVPPDKFSKDGQLWGMPTYNFENHAKTDFLWWKKRFLHMKKLYDVLRIDHFRAFADYYEIKAGARNALFGQWKEGVGFEFFEKMRQSNVLPDEIIAEDLGQKSDALVCLLEKTGFAGIKLLQDAFFGKDAFESLPENVPKNCVYYTGTHDNNTALGWFSDLSENEQKAVEKILPPDALPFSHRFIKAAFSSSADTVIIPFQDYLLKGKSARMNTPATKSGNWCWRAKDCDFSSNTVKTVRKLSFLHNL